MIVKEITDLPLVTKFFITDGKLFLNCMADEDIEAYEYGKWTPNPHSAYLGVYENDKLICILRTEQLTNLSLLCHLYVKSDLWGTGTSLEIGKELENWIRDNTKISKLIVSTPANLDPVITYGKKLGFIVESKLQDAIYWREQIVDMLLLTKFIWRD